MPLVVMLIYRAIYIVYYFMCSLMIQEPVHGRTVGDRGKKKQRISGTHLPGLFAAYKKNGLLYQGPVQSSQLSFRQFGIITCLY